MTRTLADEFDFDRLGLGLRYRMVRLVPVDAEWAEVASRVIVDVASTLGDSAVAIEHIGSTAIPTMLAKPVLDLAVGVDDDSLIVPISERLVPRGWIYRGDAGDQGGHVFVLEHRPHHRVAHLHVVQHDGVQWRRYLALRELLRGDATARSAYESTKAALAETFSGENDPRHYTDGKSGVIAELLNRPDGDMG